MVCVRAVQVGHTHVPLFQQRCDADCGRFIVWENEVVNTHPYADRSKNLFRGHIRALRPSFCPHVCLPAFPSVRLLFVWLLCLSRSQKDGQNRSTDQLRWGTNIAHGSKIDVHAARFWTSLSSFWCKKNSILNTPWKV